MLYHGYRLITCHLVHKRIAFSCDDIVACCEVEGMKCCRVVVHTVEIAVCYYTVTVKILRRVFDDLLEAVKSSFRFLPYHKGSADHDFRAL